MVQKDTLVKNRAGLHARPAALIVQTASQFESTIFIEMGSEKINAKSIMGILTMGAGYDTKVVLTAEGPDEQGALDALFALFESRFEEE
ncbi:HPr family phosphocarrier protein [Oceanispirochaeta sp.]|jgi:phosphocarrier protein HPr|uniref:HPr family phosphocarrier protein n=1 Tax=Oceanispirochaeta sp. TaxID=2035350 RepID=UPI00260603B8|nr:HPr family phosphocarrier protein [Oceanispirochaeta sp.]MDA3957181.1 HPr family phosphocarrier protein [Oceanispirochaeta sp.]